MLIPSDSDFYKQLLDKMSDGVYFVDIERRILYWNEGAVRLTGYSAEELVGRRCQDDILCHVDYMGRNICQQGCPLEDCIQDGTEHTAKVFLRHKLGRRLPVSVRGLPIRAGDGTILGAVEIFTDDSAQIEAARKDETLRRMAFLDHLTLVPNRRYLEMSLLTALTEYQMHQDPFGVLVIDVDRFKEINDSFGHNFGDCALRETAKTLVASLRPNDIVGRWGGDEFVAIVRSVTPGGLNDLARRCVAIVARTAIPGGDGRDVHVQISVGATMVHLDDAPGDLVHRADELMYQSKAKGRGCATTG